MARDWTGFGFSSMSELVPAVAEEVLNDQDLAQASSMFNHRGLYLLRCASRKQILEELVSFDKFLSSPAGLKVHAVQPFYFGQWRGLAKLLYEAARRSDAQAIPSILRDHPAHATLLAILQRLGDVPLGRINPLLKISLPEQAHMMRDLDEADIIEKFLNKRKMTIRLGPRGNDAIKISASL